MKMSDLPIPLRQRVLDANPGYSGRAVVAETPKVPTDGYRSNLERAYAARLDELRMAGEVTAWWHEAVKLRIAKGKHRAYFTPDFLVVTRAGEFEFHETKGFRREAAMVRLKTAAGEFPFKFLLVTREAGEWMYEVF